MRVSTYRRIRRRLVVQGYGGEIAWAQNRKPVRSAEQFWREFAWVVINSGMKNQVAEKIWERVLIAIDCGEPIRSAFGHPGKVDAIEFVRANAPRLLRNYRRAKDKLAWLETLPWIGSITKYHLAKNFGLDVAKPDRHLVRISGGKGVYEFCARLAALTGDRVATVDMVIWRAANLGWI